MKSIIENILFFSLSLFISEGRVPTSSRQLGIAVFFFFLRRGIAVLLFYVVCGCVMYRVYRFSDFYLKFSYLKSNRLED